MRATVMFGAGDIRVENVSDPVLESPTDAVVRVVLASICGSDLWPYRGMPEGGPGRRMGHEFIGVVEDIGSAVGGLRPGDVVLAPYLWADNVCDFCTTGLYSSCRNGGLWGLNGIDGGQGEAVRVPYAQGTLVKLPVEERSELLPALLTLSDVFSTGHHAAVTGGVGPGTTVTVVGDGAVGVSAVLAARRLGAERILLLGRHGDRMDRGREFGATDLIDGCAAEAVERIKEATGGHGTNVVLECVGTRSALESAVEVVRDGGTISRVGLPQYEESNTGFEVFRRNITFTGGAAPARAYIDELLPDVLDRTIDPGKVFDRTVNLDCVADGYRAMAEREVMKVLVAVAR